MKNFRKFAALALVVILAASFLTGCAEKKTEKVHWKATGGDPAIAAKATAAPEKIVSFGSYPNQESDKEISGILSSNVVMDPVTGLWTEYEKEETDDAGTVHKVYAKYDLQTGLYLYEVTEGDTSEVSYHVLENGKYYKMDPIEWIILAEQGDSYVLLAKDVLDGGVPFLDVYSVSNWAESSVRDWLNGTDEYAKGGVRYTEKWNFIDRAFNDTERAAMKAVTLNTADNEDYGTSGGGETSDTVYLLAAQELDAYFGEALSAQAFCTPYAASRGAKTDKSMRGLWWLRSPGMNTYFQGIDRNGDLSTGGYAANDTELGIRPVILVRKDAVKQG